MIRKLALALAAVALAGAAGGAFAGDGVCGCDCANACPLARQVNECRSTGGEALAVSKKVQQDTIKFVVKNLGAI